MRRKRITQILILLLVSFTILGAQSVERTRNEAADLPLVFDVNDYDSLWIRGDTNNDGVIDYALRLDDTGQKLYEAVDFNRDGYMDDFYLYNRGVLSREELDTNFDGKIDLWIEMHDGVRVREYRRDTNFDGTVDLIREFGSN